MGTQIIKIDREHDRYMAWSSIVEAPLVIGTRQQMIEYLLDDYRPGTARYRDEAAEAERRLARADETGSTGYRPFGCTWNDHGEIYQQRGYLPRANFAAFADILEADAAGGDGEEWNFDKMPQEQWDKLCDLLEPFEDDDEVRRKRR